MTEILVFMLIFDRAQLSRNNSAFIDETGHVFVVFPIPSLAATLGKGETVIKQALRGLMLKGYIIRKHQGRGRPDRIYPLISR